MKKIIVTMLTFVLMVSLILPTGVMAKQDQELENAIKTAKKLLSIPETYDNFNYNLEYYEGKKFFSLSWSDKKNKLGSVHVNIDNEGFITGYSKYNMSYEKTETKMPNISKEKALEISNAFIQKVNPEIAKKVKYKEEKNPLNINAMSYGFTYIRQENNFLFPNHTINIEVNNITGEVQSFYSNWDKKFSFENPSKIISLEEAQEIFKEKVKLYLVYKLKYHEKEQKPYLVYTTVDGSKYIDAETGKIITGSNGYFDVGMEKNMMDSKNKEESNLTPEEVKAIENMKETISDEEAIEVARKQFSLGKEFKVNAVHLYNDWGNAEDYVWNIYFVKENKKEEGLQVSIDAKTKEIKSFYKNKNRVEEKVKYSKEEALKLAKDFIQNIQKDKYNKVEYVTWDENMYVPYNEEEQREYVFRFVRKENGAYFLENGFYLTIDATSGEVLHYNYSWYKKELPTTKNVRPVNEMYEVLFNQMGMIPQYIVPYYSNRKEDQEEKTELVYAVNTNKPLILDAHTKDILNYNGEIYKENTVIEYSDIENSFAKDKIKILAEYGIVLPGNQFKPKENITQKELLYLLLKVGNYYVEPSFEEEDIYTNALNTNLIQEQEKAPNEFVTREETVKYIIRVLQYEKVANLKNIYVLPFTDEKEIKQELKGHVAIAYGFNIIKGSNGKFYPKQKLTKEETAVIIYNLLNAK